MSRPMDDRIAELTAGVEQLEKAVASAQSRLESAEHTAPSADRSVRATVSGRGELTAVEFLDGKYRTMAAAQLSAAVLEAVTAARAAMARTVVDTVDPLFSGVHIDGMRELPKPDWAGVFGSLLDEEGARGGSRDQARFRDEIHEDDEETPAARPEQAGDPRTGGAR